MSKLMSDIRTTCRVYSNDTDGIRLSQRRLEKYILDLITESKIIELKKLVIGKTPSIQLQVIQNRLKYIKEICSRSKERV